MPLVAEHDGPVYLRISRAATISVHDSPPELEIGKGVVLRDGCDVTLVGAGAMVGRCLHAAHSLDSEGVSARVIEIHTIKPLDTQLIIDAAAETGAVVTAEEHTVVGGLGRAVAEALGEDPDVLLALAGKVSSDLQGVIRQRPQLFAELIRQLRDLPDHAVLRLVREVRDGDW